MTKRSDPRADPLAGVPRDLAAVIRLDCVRTLYQQIPNSFVAAMGVTAYMVATMWDKVPGVTIGFWLGLQGLAQLHRFAVLYRYRRAEANGEVNPGSAARWASRYTLYMTAAGIVWGSAAFFFFRPESPLSQVFTMCGLYGISGGAVPGNAYHPPAILGFLGTIFAAVMARMLLLGGVDYIVLGVASLFFMLIMMLFCRVQHVSILDSLRIRHENASLLDRLREQSGIAEAARVRAEQANLAKSRFLAAASHDLRQPLHALGLFSASLRALPLTQDQFHLMERIQQNVDSLETLFNDLLDISRLDAGQIVPAPVNFALRDLLERVASRHDALADEKGLDLRVRETSVTVYSDPVLCEAILGNLVHNAIRYTRTGGVLIGARVREGQISVEVWDTGIGIGTAHQAQVFDEYFQAGNPERDRRKGMGLGLAIARRTAMLLGADLTLHSTPGRGSVFRFRLPIGEAPRPLADPGPAEPVAADALSGRCVVVVDDEASIREGMDALLTRWGCRTVVAGDAAEAAAALKDRRLRPDLIIADYRLRDDLTGGQALEALRREFDPGCPGLIITGDISPDRLADAARDGHRLLHKPVRPAQLRAVANFLLTART